jgi:hypothetical protein
MRGTILGVHDGRGVLLSADERRLNFALSEWRSAGAPTAGQIVDFVEEAGEARGVFLAPNAGFGAPRAYSTAFVLSAIALGCFILGFIIPVLLPTLAALVLGVIGANQARAENEETALMMARIAWIGSLVVLIIGVFLITAIFVFVGALGLAALNPFDPY